MHMVHVCVDVASDLKLYVIFSRGWPSSFLKNKKNVLLSTVNALQVGPMAGTRTYVCVIRAHEWHA
jgi:hypothetical protein